MPARPSAATSSSGNAGSLVEIGIQPLLHESMWPVEVVDLSTSSASSLGFVRRVSTFYGRCYHRCRGGSTMSAGHIE
ncbi:hypothetical protein R1flu_029214 [Riccia fluitans]|uniref:Uncharacterized protein n=1 Tax=Riccia fluitans TaxID=41844 RepID=A0ABD1XNZ2_9MARC